MEMGSTRSNGALPAQNGESSQQTGRRPVSGFEDWGPAIEPSPDAESDSEGVPCSFDTGLEVDDDGDVDIDDVDDDGQAHSIVGYAKSTYPRANPAHRVERPYHNGEVDDGTM